MLLRKINAGLSLLSTLLLMDHAIFHGVWMLSRGSVEKTANSLPRILFGVMVLHAIISIVLAVRGHKGAEKRKCNDYFNINIATMIQRISGVLLFIYTVLHIVGTTGILRLPQVVHAVLTPVFFTIALTHTALSVSKAFITLGIGNAKLIKGVDVAVKVLCVMTLIAGVAGFYLYLV